jgi:hypothetical protein
MNEQNFRDVLYLVDLAKKAQSRADAAREQLADVILEGLRREIPRGSIIDLRQHGALKNRPYLWGLRTVGGNDRGTKIFRVEQILSVEVNVAHLPLSKWFCEAVPVSEKTGKDMAATVAKSYGHNSKTVVRMSGDLGYDYGMITPDDDAATGRLLKMIVGATS